MFQKWHILKQFQVIRNFQGLQKWYFCSIFAAKQAALSLSSHNKYCDGREESPDTAGQHSG